jgi:hypothetical protein
MHDKRSCRAYRSYFKLISGCNACTEKVLWICDKSYGTEDVTDSHNYFRIAYRRGEGNSSSTMLINSNDN